MKNYHEIVDLLSTKTKEISTTNAKSESHIVKDNQLEKEVARLKEEIARIKEKDDKTTEENNRLKSMIFALKEKSSGINFFNFDDYEEGSIIGEGGTSSIKVFIKKEKVKYAKKEMKEFNHKNMQRFLSEGEILFKLPHPCIIRIIGVNYGNESHAPSIILSLEPTSLEKAIQEKELDDKQKNRIAVEIVLGMRYIHHRNIMHRDLKPSNILLSKNRHVRISDFGLAKEEDLETSQSKGVGTLRFMAPELFNEEDEGFMYNNKVDVYSFGITLIYIVTGSYPKFNLRNISMGILPSLPSTIVNWVRELIIKCISTSPENRPSFAEIFEIMKDNNYDLFNESKNKKLTTKQLNMKQEIEARVLKIEAFEYQHQED